MHSIKQVNRSILFGMSLAVSILLIGCAKEIKPLTGMVIPIVLTDDDSQANLQIAKNSIIQKVIKNSVFKSCSLEATSRYRSRVCVQVEPVFSKASPFFVEKINVVYRLKEIDSNEFIRSSFDSFTLFDSNNRSIHVYMVEGEQKTIFSYFEDNEFLDREVLVEDVLEDTEERLEKDMPQDANSTYETLGELYGNFTNIETLKIIKDIKNLPDQYVPLRLMEI